MRLELVLAILAVLQLVLLVLAASQLRRLRRDLIDRAKVDSGVPTLLIVSTLNKIDHRMDGLENRLQHLVEQRRRVPDAAPPAVMAASTAHAVPITSNYELAQQLARDGCDLDMLMKRCNLSRNEAELVLRLYARQG